MTALEKLARLAEETAKIEIDGPGGYEVAEVTNWPEVVLAILNGIGCVDRLEPPVDAQRE